MVMKIEYKEKIGKLKNGFGPTTGSGAASGETDRVRAASDSLLMLIIGVHHIPLAAAAATNVVVRRPTKNTNVGGKKYPPSL
jgi:hypothetical protein